MGKANFLSFLCSRWWNMRGTATGNTAGATTSSNPSPRKDIPPISSVSKERTCMLESHLHVNYCSCGMIRFRLVRADTGNPIYIHFSVSSTARTLERWDVLAQFTVPNHFYLFVCVVYRWLSAAELKKIRLLGLNLICVCTCERAWTKKSLLILFATYSAADVTKAVCAGKMNSIK